MGKRAEFLTGFMVLVLASGCMGPLTAQDVPESAAELYSERDPNISPPTEGFRDYARAVEQRIEEDGFDAGFLRVAHGAQSLERLRQGEVLTSTAAALSVKPSVAIRGAQVQHWVGAIFVPGVTLAQAISSF